MSARTAAKTKGSKGKASKTPAVPNEPEVNTVSNGLLKKVLIKPSSMLAEENYLKEHLLEFLQVRKIAFRKKGFSKEMAYENVRDQIQMDWDNRKATGPPLRFITTQMAAAVRAAQAARIKRDALGRAVGSTHNVTDAADDESLPDTIADEDEEDDEEQELDPNPVTIVRGPTKKAKVSAAPGGGLFRVALPTEGSGAPANFVAGQIVILDNRESTAELSHLQDCQVGDLREGNVIMGYSISDSLPVLYYFRAKDGDFCCISTPTTDHLPDLSLPPTYRVFALSAFAWKNMQELVKVANNSSFTITLPRQSTFNPVNLMEYSHKTSIGTHPFGGAQLGSSSSVLNSLTALTDSGAVVLEMDDAKKGETLARNGLNRTAAATLCREGERAMKQGKLTLFTVLVSSPPPAPSCSIPTPYLDPHRFWSLNDDAIVWRPQLTAADLLLISTSWNHYTIDHFASLSSEMGSWEAETTVQGFYHLTGPIPSFNAHIIKGQLQGLRDALYLYGMTLDSMYGFPQEIRTELIGAIQRVLDVTKSYYLGCLNCTTPRLFSFVTSHFMYDIEQLHQLCLAGRIASPKAFGDCIRSLPDMTLGGVWRSELDGIRTYNLSINGYFSLGSQSSQLVGAVSNAPAINGNPKTQKEKERKQRKRQREVQQADIAAQLQAVSTAVQASQASAPSVSRNLSHICCYNMSTKGCDKGSKCRYEHRPPSGRDDEQRLDTFFTGRSDNLKRKQ